MQQPLTVGTVLAEPVETAAAPAVDLEASSRRRPSGGPARAPRHERRDTLRSLAAELSAAAARIDDVETDDLPDIRLPEAPALRLDIVGTAAAGPAAAPPDAHIAAKPDDDTDFADLRLAAMADSAAAVPVDAPQVEITATAVLPASEPAAAPVENPVVTTRLEIARAEADVLAAKYDAEAAARAAAERRLADAQDELNFLRAEIQMVGQKRRKPHGRLRRALALLTGRRRRVVPANSPKAR